MCMYFFKNKKQCKAMAKTSIVNESEGNETQKKHIKHLSILNMSMLQKKMKLLQPISTIQN